MPEGCGSSGLLGGTVSGFGHVHFLIVYLIQIYIPFVFVYIPFVFVCIFISRILEILSDRFRFV